MSVVLLIVLLIFAISLSVFLFYKNSLLRSEIETRARQQHEAWRKQELQSIREQYQEITHKEATLQLQRWQQESEEGIRKDAIEKSRAVILGKVSEHLVPFFPGFSHNPKDARFIGTPVDFVVFDGLDDGEVRGITFVEVKTGASSLTTRERQIRNIVKQRVVEWEEFRIPSPLSSIPTSSKEVLVEVTEEQPCRRCGRENRAQARFCGYCGESL